MLKIKSVLCCVLAILLLSFVGCASNETPNDDGAKPTEITLTTENIGDYIAYSYLYNKSDMTETREGTTYYSYTLKITVNPKKTEYTFKNAVVTLGRFVTLYGANNTMYANDDYTYTVYLDTNGNGILESTVWVRGGWEKEAFTKQYPRTSRGEARRRTQSTSQVPRANREHRQERYETQSKGNAVCPSAKGLRLRLTYP